MPTLHDLKHSPSDSQVKRPLAPTQPKHPSSYVLRYRPDNMFLRLPPEIRNMIYSDLLVPTSQPVHPTPSPTPNHNHLTLLSVCKQVHNEALPVYYGNNRFVLENPRALYDFLRSISIPRRRQITHLTLNYWGRRSTHATAAFRKLGQCIRLAYLKVYPERCVDKFPGVKAFRAMRGLKEVVVLDGCDESEVGGEFWEGVKKELVGPKKPCKVCERAGKPV